MKTTFVAWPPRFLITYVLAAAGFFYPFGTQAAIPIDFPSPAPDDSLGVAYDCLAALALNSHGIAGMLERAKVDASELARMSRKDEQGRLGWPYIQKMTPGSGKCGAPGALDAFKDGTCNPPNTPYMIQTGYAVTCLAQLSIATKDKKYLEMAKQTMADSWKIGVSLPDSGNSFYYWYSYHSNDQGRYVRNTNLIMGLGAAWMYAATGGNGYRDRALAIARAEHREIKAGNFGYFGITDPKYRAKPRAEALRIENHIPHQVKALKDIGTLLGDTQAIADSQIMLDAFLNCHGEHCRPNNCNVWAAPSSCKATATIAPCILADQGKENQARCKNVLEELPRLNAFQIFLRYSPSDAEQLERK